MSKPPKKAKRVIRPLTEEETKRVAEARQDVEAQRDEILREGRVRKKAWVATRCEVDETIARLKQERERLGLSLADVEQRSGLRRSVLSRLENDSNSNPTLLTLQRYAAALGLSIHITVQASSEMG